MQSPPIPNLPDPLEKPNTPPGHRPTFWVAVGSTFMERFLYYGFRAVLTLFLFQYLDEMTSYQTYATYGMLGYLGMVAMGLVGDLFLERRWSTALGMGLVGLGYLSTYLLTVLGIGNPIWGLALAAGGTGLFRTANFTQLLNAFPSSRSKLSAAYLTGVLINVGAFLAPLTIGYLATMYGFEWGPLLTGILALVWAGALMLFNTKGMVPAEASENRSALSQAASGPVLGLCLVGAVCLGLVVMGHGLSGPAEEVFQVLVWLVFGFFTLGILVLPPVLGRASAKGMLTLVVGVLAMVLFWAFVEILWGNFYALENFPSNSGRINGVLVGLPIAGSLLLGGLGLLIPLRRKFGPLLAGALVTLAWFLAFLLTLAIATAGPLFGTDSGGILALGLVFGVVELLLLQPIYLWIYHALPGGFRSAGLALAFSAPVLAFPIVRWTSGLPAGSWAGLQTQVADFVPWLGGVLLLLVGILVFWWVAAKKEA